MPPETRLREIADGRPGFNEAAQASPPAELAERSRTRRGARHALLRTTTAELHAAAENVVDRAGYFASASAFGDYLRRMHLFYRGVVEGTAPSARTMLRRWRITDRIDWLSSDLAELCVVPIAARPQVAAHPALSDSTRLLGGLYVMVGSTLGARLLVRSTYHIGLPTGRGRAYLSSMASDTCWPEFLAQLESEAITSTGDLTAGAMATFDSVVEHLSKAMPT